MEHCLSLHVLQNVICNAGQVEPKDASVLPCKSPFLFQATAGCKSRNEQNCLLVKTPENLQCTYTEADKHSHTPKSASPPVLIHCLLGARRNLGSRQATLDRMRREQETSHRQLRLVSNVDSSGGIRESVSLRWPHNHMVTSPSHVKCST